jgi:hypothetical protein
MKIKITLIGIVFLLNLFSTRIYSQLASGIPYLFSVDTGVVGLPGGTIYLVPRMASQNEWDTLVAPFGWSFSFAGTTYTKFCVSTNGWLALMPGSVVTPSWPAFIIPPNPANELNNNTTGYPIIAPLWDDLSTSLVRYTVVGNILTVVWTSRWQAANAVPLTFFIRLNGTTNTITFYYRNDSTYVPVSPSASIGIAGICPGDFYSVYPTSNNAAYVDSVTENTNIGDTVSPNVRPYNVSFKFTPYSPNDNCSGNYPALHLGTIDSSCSMVFSANIHAVDSSSPTCSTPDDKDVWFSFTKPVGISDVLVTTAPSACSIGSVSGTTLEIYDSCGGAVLSCSSTGSTYPTFGEVLLMRSSSVSETLYARVTGNGDLPGKFNICARDNTLSHVGINDYREPEKIKIFTDAVNSTILIMFPDNYFQKNGSSQFYLIDLTGRVVLTHTIQNSVERISSSELKHGIYNCRIGGLKGDVFYRKIFL